MVGDMRETNSTMTADDRARNLETEGFHMIPGKDRQHSTIEVRMAGLGETWTLPNVPIDMIPGVVAIAQAGILVYGPGYSRQAAEAIRDASRPLAHDDAEAAAYFVGKALAHLPG